MTTAFDESVGAKAVATVAVRNHYDERLLVAGAVGPIRTDDLLITNRFRTNVEFC